MMRVGEKRCPEVMVESMESFFFCANCVVAGRRRREFQIHGSVENLRRLLCCGLISSFIDFLAHLP